MDIKYLQLKYVIADVKITLVIYVIVSNSHYFFLISIIMY